MCSNENYFSVFVSQSIVTIQHQVCEDISRYKNIFLLGMLTTAQYKEENAQTCHSASAIPRDCTTFVVHYEGTQDVQERDLCCMWSWSHS